MEQVGTLAGVKQKQFSTTAVEDCCRSAHNWSWNTLSSNLHYTALSEDEVKEVVTFHFSHMDKIPSQNPGDGKYMERKLILSNMEAVAHWHKYKGNVNLGKIIDASLLARANHFDEQGNKDEANLIYETMVPADRQIDECNPKAVYELLSRGRGNWTNAYRT